MPNLPESRVQRSRPFEQIGLDYLGPSRLNPLLERFVARRGYPKLVLSDNASQFQLVFRQIMNENANFLAEKGMVWKNTIPRAPWGGGVYERLIRLTKVALGKAIGRRLLTEKEMMTLITEIEGILNTRPLIYVGFDDYRIVRPIDFILPTASLHMPINYENHEEEYTPYVLNTRDNLIKHWSSLDGWTRSAVIQLPNGKQLNRSLNMFCPMENSSDNNNDREITEKLWQEQDNFEKPIASRTRTAKKAAAYAKITSKTTSNDPLKALSLITMLPLVTVQMINANSCKWTSTIPFNIPASWSYISSTKPSRCTR
ncbi:Integrase core domain containing protein [Dirofilaria immitis]|nr:Integrase core domain containing protein [Dirofilaria immitis]